MAFLSYNLHTMKDDQKYLEIVPLYCIMYYKHHQLSCLILNEVRNLVVQQNQLQYQQLIIVRTEKIIFSTYLIQLPHLSFRYIISILHYGLKKLVFHLKNIHLDRKLSDFYLIDSNQPNIKFYLKYYNLILKTHADGKID